MKKNFRSPKFNLIKNIERTVPKNKVLNIFRKMCKIRYFEDGMKNLQESDKRIVTLLYLSLGQESISSSISEVFKGAYVLAQHRGHGSYISFGGDTLKLVDELLGLSSGCCGGKGGSPMIHDFKNKIIGHAGLIGDHVPVATGMAYIKKNDYFVCFFGDGAAEEDYVLAALGYAATRKLKILFVCDDNDLSVLTPIKDRRTWQITDVAKSFGIPSVDSSDDPWNIYHWASKYKKNLPALINVRTCRDTWHVGTGTDGKPEWDRFKITKDKLKSFFSENIINNIEREEKNWAQSLIKRRLQKL